MYTRPPQGRFPRGMRIPQNYSGNAFRPSGEEPSERTQTEEVASPSPPPSDQSEACADNACFTEPTVAALSEENRDQTAQNENASKGAPSFHFSLKNLFPGLGKDGSAFGSEELMLLALILLLSGGENNDDLILLLALLLFIR